MIVGIGVDQVEVARMAGLLTRRPERARDRLFTGGERSRCEERDPPWECYAARFAAKEALLKALGTGLGAGTAWREVEVVTDGDGCPRLELTGTARRRMEESGGRRAHVSLTHESGVATAFVVVEGRAAEG